MKEAIGIIECISLPTAIAAADAAVKSAYVNLIGYELAKGPDLVTVKISGDVSAVQAAVEAAVETARSITGVAGSIVIPRPAEDLDMLIVNPDTVGCRAGRPDPEMEKLPFKGDLPEEEELFKEDLIFKAEVLAEEEDLPKEEDFAEEENSDEEEGGSEGEVSSAEKIREVTNSQSVPSVTCNLCKDPACPRLKGQPRIRCIHYEG